MKKLISILFVVIFSTACNNSNSPSAPQTSQKPARDTLIHAIQLLEQRLSTEQSIDQHMGATMVTAYLNFFNNYPKDALSADYLFKAADVSMNIGQSEKAIELFKKVNDIYPNYKKGSFALFLQGFIYETQLKDQAKAREIYNKVSAEYPNTKIAEDAKACVANLGKSDEELIKEFEAKNKLK